MAEPARRTRPLRSVPLAAFERSPEAVFTAGPDGSVEFLNAAAASILECSRSAAVGRPCWQVAALRTRSGHPFCGPDCPVQRHARYGSPPMPLHLMSRRAAGAPRFLDMHTIFLPPLRRRRQAVLHILSPVTPQIAAGTKETGFRKRRFRPGLSRREKEVLQLIACGLKTREIASTLFISPTTVNNHVQSILRKLGVHRRIDAVLAAFGRSR